MLVPLKAFSGEQKNLNDLIYDQLQAYGGITDKDLVIEFIKDGGFLFLIDGLNEIEDNKRDSVKHFINFNGKSNFICISSQVIYEDLNLEHQEMAQLDKETIKEFIQKKVLAEENRDTHIKEKPTGEETSTDQEKVEAVIKYFPSNYDTIYKNPQELEFAIQIAREKKEVPPSKDLLYKKLFEPVLENWNQDEDKQQFSRILYERAFEMLAKPDPSFDCPEQPLLKEIQNQLLEKKFLIKRGTHYLFKHDLIRASLAMKYFVSNWEAELTNPSPKVTRDWESMLELFLLNQVESPNPNGNLGKFFSLLIKKNISLSRDLFNDLETTHPQVMDPLKPEFDAEIGQAYRKN